MNDKVKKYNIILIALSFTLYVVSYFLKLTYNCNIVNFESEFGVTHSESGLVTTFFFIAYGIGQVVNGFFAKKYNIRIVVPTVLFLSIALNIIVFTIPSDSFFIIKYLWLLNGALLSFLWPLMIRVITENINEKFKNTAIVLLGTTTPIGSGACYALSSLFTNLGHYKRICVLAVSLAFVLAVLWLIFFNFLKNNTEGGLEEFKEEEKRNVYKNTKGFIVFIVIICLFSVISDFARDGIETWFPSIIQEKYNFKSSSAILFTLPLSLIAIFSTFLAVIMNKKIKNHATLCTVFAIFANILFGVEAFFNKSNAVLSVSLVSIVFMSLDCIIAVCTTMLPVRLGVHHKNAGFYAGLFNGCCYLGSAISTYALGLLADKIGWNSTLKILFFVLLIMTLTGTINTICHAIEKKTENKLK